MTSSKLNKKIRARLAATQALYLYNQGNNTIDEIIIDFITGTLGNEVIDENPETGEETFIKVLGFDEALFKTLFTHSVKNKTQISELINANLDTNVWTPERLEQVLLAILSTGISELQIDNTTERPIIINEYVNLAKSFYGKGPESSLTNAILDKLAKVL